MNVIGHIFRLLSLLPLIVLGSSTACGPDTCRGGIGKPWMIVSFENTETPLLDVSPSSLEPLSASEALKANLLDPVSTEPLEPAPPLVMPFDPASFNDRASATDCMTAAIYYEAAMEPEIGKRAVAQVILNRVRHPAFPNSVCEVVMQGSERRTGCQFTFTCDGSLYRRPRPQGWQSARRISLAALSGFVEPSVGMATHYHASYVRPYWAGSLTKVAVLGNHVFYRWSGSWGRRRAFTDQVALGRDYLRYRSASWRMAASYLFDFGGQSLPDFMSPIGHELAASGNALTAPVEPVPPDVQPPPASPLLADTQRGTLVADETSGTLIVE